MRVEHLSVSVRLRRIRVEAAFVSVPITDELTCPDRDNSNLRSLDGERIFRKAIEMGKLELTKWEPDGDWEIQPHPIQMARHQRID